MRNIVIVLIVVAVLVGGFLYFRTTTTSPKTSPQNQPESYESSPSSQTVPGYQGKVLAGSSSPFLEFNKADYDKALSEGKIILLDFYANWCPICRAETPAIHAGFGSLTTDKVIGFRVNFKDSDTDKDEENLAKQFNIPYQHTKVILKDGKEVSRSVESWDKAKFDEEIEKALGS